MIGPEVGQSPNQLFSINGVNPGEIGGDLFCLVALQSAYEVPTEVGVASGRSCLLILKPLNFR